jgi:hypothetical protein
VTAERYDVVALLLTNTQWAAEPDGTQEDLSLIHNEKISPRSTLHSHFLILQVVVGSEVTEDDCIITRALPWNGTAAFRRDWRGWTNDQR